MKKMEVTVKDDVKEDEGVSGITVVVKKRKKRKKKMEGERWK